MKTQMIIRDSDCAQDVKYNNLNCACVHAKCGMQTTFLQLIHLVIVDLSCPHGFSVNDAISKNCNYKRDLRRAYCQVPFHPREWCICINMLDTRGQVILMIFTGRWRWRGHMWVWGGIRSWVLENVSKACPPATGQLVLGVLVHGNTLGRAL